MKTLGKKITELRKKYNMTQDQLATEMNVSSQAVSKWENDLSIPDIPILVELSNYFHVSLDDLLKNEESEVVMVPENSRKSLDRMMLRILVHSKDGDKVRVNVPMSLIKLGAEIGIDLPQISGNKALQGIDLNQIFSLVEQGVLGRIVEVESADGDTVTIEVE
jgi:Predicted transcriptional regulators